MAFRIKHIFYPTDFSQNSKQALLFAAEIACRTEAKLTLLHASPAIMDIVPNYEEDRGALVENIRNLFDAHVKDLIKNPKYRDLNITTTLLSGEIITNLREQVDLHKPDLIVMGTKGATGNRNSIFGSVTTAIINKCEVPVLAIPPGIRLNKLKNITFATDFHEEDLKTLQEVVYIAKLFDAKVDIVHIAKDHTLNADIQFRGFRDLVKETISYSNISFNIEYNEDFYPAIVDYAIDHKTSLLAIVRYKKGFWQSLTEHDHSKEIAFNTKVPLLVLTGSDQ